MPHNEAPVPALGQVAVAEVVTRVGVVANRTNPAADFNREIEVRAGADQAAWNRAGGIVEVQLRVGAEFKVGLFLTLHRAFVGRARRIACHARGFSCGVMTEERQQPRPKVTAKGCVAGVMLEEAPLHPK